MNFARRLKMLRSKQMLSITKLAKKSGLSQSFVCRVESGELQPTLKSLHKLSSGLGISVGELLGEDLMSEPENPTIQRVVNNIKRLSQEQLGALDVFLASISSEYAKGEKPLLLKDIQLNPSDENCFEIELTFSHNVSSIIDSRIPDGTERNKSCFQVLDENMNKVPMELISGDRQRFGPDAHKSFIITPLKPLDDDKTYTLYISRFLQANNYKYLKADHTVTFKNREIVDISPFNKELCDLYFSLALENSNIVNGAENVPVNPDIRLTFSNDIGSQTVHTNNLLCFNLQTSKNQPVDIDIIVPDPIYPYEEQKDVVIRPLYPLDHNTVYILTVSEKLMGKNHKSLGTDKVIIFTTGNAADNSKVNGKRKAKVLSKYNPAANQ